MAKSSSWTRRGSRVFRSSSSAARCITCTTSSARRSRSRRRSSRSTCLRPKDTTAGRCALVKRKELLASFVPKVGAVRYLDHIATQGEAFHKQVSTMGLEGIIAKKADTPYKAGRSPQWLKIKADRTADFAVVGFTEPKGGRPGFGALQLADLVGGSPGVRGARRHRLHREDAQRVARAAARGRARRIRRVSVRSGRLTRSRHRRPTIPEVKTTTWVEPKYVVEVRYTEWTHEGVLRHPAFLRVRDDKRVDQVERQWPARSQKPKAKGQRQSERPEAQRPDVRGRR